MSNNRAEESKVCCCVDVGTTLDNSDSTASYHHVFTHKADAEAMLETLTAQARSVESEPCKITSRFSEQDGGICLDVDFVFCCQAETFIFQLGLR